MMSNFTELESAVLHAIFSETPEIRDALERQFEAAAVVDRENTGVGFFTTIAVRADVPRVSSPSPLGREVGAKVDGLDHGMGFILFMEEGHMQTLEGFTYTDSTTELNFEELNFDVLRTPQGTEL
jgi:hypothetical protein